MDFKELGQALKEEREKKGLSIEMVMEATKISRTNIVAMESGDRNTLPHPVYTKGFVKSYARHLGLDADELSMVVDREYQDESDGPEEQIYEVSAAAERAFQETDAPERKGKSKWPLILVLIFLVVIIVLLVMNLNSNKSEEPVKEAQTSSESVEKTEPPVSTVEEVAPVDEPANDEQATSEDTATEEDVAATDETAQADPSIIEENTAEAKPEEEASVASKPEVKPESKPEPKPEAAIQKQPETKVVAAKPEKQKYDHLVVIRATSEKGCWIGLWKGDETKMYRDYVLKQGEPLRLMFNTLRRIRIGNVAGVTVTYNGKPYSMDGAQGNIQTLRFGE